MREVLLGLLHKEPSHGYELKLAIDTFFSKLVAWKTRLADPVVLLDQQRRSYLRQLRELGGLADTTTSLVGRLAVEAATLHVQADLKLLEFCEQAVSAGDIGAGG